MSGVSHPLVIVIPAFKPQFLAETLRSIAAQTRQDFHVYLCDDGSPADLRSLAADILPPERMTYRRFEPNMGARNLVRHWNRSVASVSEPWVWLFSDDDLMEPTCVETFLRTLETDGERAANVYRFNTLVIDADGRALRINPPHPARETGIEFAYHRLTLQRQSYAPEYLFRRDAWERSGGFVELPYAQGSDDASWITFAREGGIQTMQGPCVRWRFSGTNISSAGASVSVERVKGCVEFAAWLRREFASQTFLPPDIPCAFSLQTLVQDWALSLLTTCPAMFSRSDLNELTDLLERQLGVPRRRVLQAMWGTNRRLLTRKLVAPLRRLLIGEP